MRRACAAGSTPGPAATLLGLIGFFGQIDAPREEVEVAVAKCRVAGVRPIMITGD